MADDETPDCEVIGCGFPADWAYIGEGGDLYLCDAHFHPAPNWNRIGPLPYDPERPEQEYVPGVGYRYVGRDG